MILAGTFAAGQLPVIHSFLGGGEAVVVAGPWCVHASTVFTPGTVAGGTYVPGPKASQAYTAGAIAAASYTPCSFQA
jgi:hypothetical protein